VSPQIYNVQSSPHIEWYIVVVIFLRHILRKKSQPRLKRETMVMGWPNTRLVLTAAKSG
jgi:hypothetical protein